MIQNTQLNQWENISKELNTKSFKNWPAQSSDINPIENLWQELKLRLARAQPRPTNKSELFDIVRPEWNALPEKLLLSLVHSMPRRIRAVIKAKGGHTKY